MFPFKIIEFSFLISYRWDLYPGHILHAKVDLVSRVCLLCGAGLPFPEKLFPLQIRHFGLSPYGAHTLSFSSPFPLSPWPCSLGPVNPPENGFPINLLLYTLRLELSHLIIGDNLPQIVIHVKKKKTSHHSASECE